MSHKPEVTKVGIFNVQVCVPAEFTDAEVREFAEQVQPCGTTNGWFVKKSDDRNPEYKERVSCLERAGCVHVVLEA